MKAPDPIFGQMQANPSWWHRTFDGEFPASQSLPSSARFVVVGMGLAGASIAYELVQRGVPASEIALLDGARGAFGASGRNGGFVLSFPGPELLEWQRTLGADRARELMHLNVRNRQWVGEFVRRRGLPHQAGGSYFAAATPDEGREVARCHTLLGEMGLTGYQLLPDLPGPTRGFAQTIHQPADFGIHPVRYVADLVSQAKLRPVENCAVAVDGFRLLPDGIHVETERGQIRAGQLILAANAYAPLFFQRARIQVVPARNQVMIVDIPGETDNRLWGDALYYTRRGYDYWRQFPDGRLLVGGGRDKDFAGEETWELRQNRAVVGYLEGELLPRLVAGRPCSVLQRWQGTMGFTPDELPIVGWLPQAEGRVLFAGGFSGYGLGLHRVVAESAVGAILENKPFGVFDWRRLPPPPPMEMF